LKAVKIQKLIGKGVRITAPESVEVGNDVDLDRISGDNVVVHAGCRIFGKSTLILPGASLGAEAPVTVVDCQVGPNVTLNGGFFQDAVMLAGVSAGSGAHVRRGTILEEESRIAHTVGLKQTILFPFVTLGSLINFCDCFIAGGTDRQNHSEVGSSYIHFNYTPNQDKATASLIGDVPRGVMLKQAPIFLGGQGGLVGPCRLEYGTVIAAGTINRKDELRPGRLIFGGSGRSGNVPFAAGHYHGFKRILTNNIVYLANLAALGQWYDQVRRLFVSNDFPQMLLEGLQDKLQMAVDERIVRLGELIQKIVEQDLEGVENSSESSSRSLQKGHGNWLPELESFLRENRNREGDHALRDRFMELICKEFAQNGKQYLKVIKELSLDASEIGTRWLQAIVDEVTDGAFQIIPILNAQP
jgi:bifunctional UDP-N-acetylglucosamine pyrophosphorylase / glucosamine-1-phosphate N-acetyltransferase